MSRRTVSYIAIIAAALLLATVGAIFLSGGIDGFVTAASGLLSIVEESARTSTIVRVPLLILLAALSLSIYFLPSLVARWRKKANVRAIFVLNLLAGWTFVGWVVAMVWAAMVETERED